jgi:GNAT superfamily N-acetyltransferase
MSNQKIDIVKTNLETIQPFRVMFLHENNFQFVCDKCHYYGWSDDYIITLDGKNIGYGCTWGTDDRKDRDTIFEFYLVPPHRHLASRIFKQFIDLTAVIFIECQSNDLLLSSMLHEFSESIIPEAILFAEDKETHYKIEGVHFKRRHIDDDSPQHHGGYYLECNGETVAEGGFLTNYNRPYADIYMDAKEGHRQKGYGSLIVQELKKEVYRIGRVPAARCGSNNHISKATLIKAGFKVCGARLKGKIRMSTN